MNDFYFRKLDAYKLSMELMDKVYTLNNKFPSYETNALSDQLRRSVSSIPSNIAEGTGRFSIKERIHFLDISYGSLMEVLCQIEIAHRQQYISADEFNSIDDLAARVARTIYGLKKSLKEKLDKQQSITLSEEGQG